MWHCVRPKKENPRSNKRTGYEPVWLEPGELQAEGLLISKRCMADHFPDFQLHTMTKLVKSLVADAPDEELRRTVYGETADVSNTEEKWSFPSRVSSGQHTTCVNLSTMAVPTPYLRRWMMSFSGRPHDRSAPTSSGIIEVEPRAGNGLTHITPESVVRDVPPQDHAAPAEAIDEA